jgi:hypothetical protein
MIDMEFGGDFVDAPATSSAAVFCSFSGDAMLSNTVIAG